MDPDKIEVPSGWRGGKSRRWWCYVTTTKSTGWARQEVNKLTCKRLLMEKAGLYILRINISMQEVICILSLGVGNSINEILGVTEGPNVVPNFPAVPASASTFFSLCYFLFTFVFPRSYLSVLTMRPSYHENCFLNLSLISPSCATLQLPVTYLSLLAYLYCL